MIEDKRVKSIRKAVHDYRWSTKRDNLDGEMEALLGYIDELCDAVDSDRREFQNIDDSVRDIKNVLDFVL